MTPYQFNPTKVQKVLIGCQITSPVVAVDHLTGGVGLDWYFAKLAALNLDIITDLDSADGEVVN